MEEVDKDWMMIRMVGSPRQRAVKQLLLLYQKLIFLVKCEFQKSYLVTYMPWLHVVLLLCISAGMQVCTVITIRFPL